MSLPRSATGITALLLSLHSPVMSATFTIDNPAANIYNPAANMDNPSPLSPPTKPIPPPTVTKEITPAIPPEQIKKPPQVQPKPVVPNKNYNYKSVGVYLTAAKNAFNRDDYVGFVAITEDALRRISAGTLRASKKTKQTLVKYKKFGYGLLEKVNE